MLAKYDVITPHALVDAVAGDGSKFRLGRQRDACEFAAFVAEATGLDQELLRVSVAGAVNDELPKRHAEILLPNEIERGSEPRLAAQEGPVSMQRLIGGLLDADALRLRAAPPVLAVRVPQYLDAADNEEEALQWIDGEAAWGDGSLDLSARCAFHCHGAAQAQYRLKAFARYCGRPAVASRAISSGHFAARFREGEQWYEADDLAQEEKVRALEEPPKHFPYLCFFEHVHGP